MNEPFETATARHRATVLRVCRAILGPGPDADDAWAETFLAALQAWPALAQETNVQAWLVRVAGRKSVDVLRGRSRRALPYAQVPDPSGPEGRNSNDATGAFALWDLVARLPHRQRLAIAYHFFGGLPHTETAALTGSTPAAVRRAAADGLHHLRHDIHALEEPTHD